VALVAGSAIAIVSACSDVSHTQRIGIVAPDRAQFDPVGKFFDYRCGSTDCHGTRVRNFQVFGCEGLRLDPKDTPGCRKMNNGKDTTSDELDATYRSLVGLEPVVMTNVVVGKGQHPELLTFVRKARGDEAHKGGILITPGDDQDHCITSWLAGTTDVDACTKATPTLEYQ
jgi:hypothetical protein